jgi:hypothetical protein
MEQHQTHVTARLGGDALGIDIRAVSGVIDGVHSL